MVNRRSSDAAPPPQPVAPVVKRKRRASCLGEQERRERKRAIDREAQRSLREKTKTHIAELERTIEILRNQDRNGTTASLLSEIESLRAENERLRDVIDGVRSVIGGELFGRTAPASTNTALSNEVTGAFVEDKSPTASSVGHHSPHQQRDSISYSQLEAKPPPSLPSPQGTPPQHISNPFEFNAPLPTASSAVDLDGMTVMPITTASGPMDLSRALVAVEELSEVEGASMLDTPDSPLTAAWAPFINEIFGPGWRCPSPVVLHIGSPADSSTAVPANESTICPIWRKSNELFGKVFTYPPRKGGASTSLSHGMEAGLLFLGIKNGWDSFTEWMQSPVLQILKSVDRFLFVNTSPMDRLAAAYKSFKLLNYYLNPTKEELEKVPEWLRPSTAQARTKHPIALDFFAWRTLRDRLVQHHLTIFQNSTLSECYSQYLRFDWPFSFDDAFYYDELLQGYFPSPLFERYHGDMRYWTVTEKFYEKFPEMRADIEGDRRAFCEIEESA